MTLGQLAALFAPPAGSGRHARWGYLGVRGDWALHPIHLYGLLPGTALGMFLRREIFADRPFANDYVGFAESRAVIARLRADPYGIGIADLNQRVPGLKVVALARCAGCAPSGGAQRSAVRANIRSTAT